MVTFISFIVVLGVLIFIHELGHFGAAKFSGVGVEKFSLGFGPRLFGVKRGGTDYMLSALPLGGYVKMVGEAAGEDVGEDEVKRSFTHKPVAVRAAIVAAGPVMNLVLAAVLLPAIFMLGIQLPAFLEKEAKIGYAIPDGPAAKAGILRGDVITAVGEKRIENWEELLSAFEMNPSTALDIALLRDGFTVKLKLIPDSSTETGGGYAGVLPEMIPLINDIAPGYPAEEAGLKPGDRIVAIGNSSVTHWAELEDLIHKDGDKKDFVVARDGAELKFEITPKYNEDSKAYLIGITRREEQVYKRYGFAQAIKKGAETGVDMTGRLFAVIKGLIAGKYSLKTLGGPIMIAQVAGKAAKTGVVDLLTLVAFLSLQLGIINLLPIPVLDGGHILFCIVEVVKGSPLSDRVLAVSQQIGIALIVALMALVTYNDIFRLLN
mgnify:CR=1 FL=1